MLFLDPARPDAWPTDTSPYEADALAFCRAWLGGQTEFVLHTSGSTGTPKPITLTRVQMRASAHLTGRTLGLRPGDGALICLNIRYVAGVMMLVRGLELGLPMTLIEPVSNPLAGFDANESRFAFTAFVPLQLQTMLDEPAVSLPILNQMRAILVGGAATSPALERAVQAIEAPVYATYGMTETVSHIALRRLNGPRLDGPGLDGPDARDWFTALDGVELGLDERGCLNITSAATNFERIQTNDVVDLLPNPTGESVRFRLLGRADTIINSGGVKVQPERVERIVQDVLHRFGNVPRLFVAGLPDERLGQRVVVVSEPSAISSEQWNAVQQAVRDALGPYWVPKEWLLVPAFAETPTGKIDRAATIARAT